MNMFRDMAVSIVLLLSCSISTGVLGSPSLLPSCSIMTITIPLHNTIILRMSCLSTSLSFYNVYDTINTINTINTIKVRC